MADLQPRAYELQRGALNTAITHMGLGYTDPDTQVYTEIIRFAVADAAHITKSFINTRQVNTYAAAMTGADAVQLPCVINTTTLYESAITNTPVDRQTCTRFEFNAATDSCPFTHALQIPIV